MDELLYITFQIAVFALIICLLVVFLLGGIYAIIFLIGEIYNVSKPYINYIKSMRKHGK